MKKALYSVLMTGLVLVSLAACKKSDSGGGGGDPAAAGGTVATTPNTTCNIPGYNCNPSLYQSYNGSFQVYNTTVTGQGYCGCPAGTRPVMNITWGLSCAPDAMFQGLNPNYSYYGYHYHQVFPQNNYWGQPQNTQWTSIPQTPFVPTMVPGQASSCYMTAYSSCLTQDNTTDGYGRIYNPYCGNYSNGRGYCVAAGGATNIGFCVQSNGYRGGYGGYGGYGYGGWGQRAYDGYGGGFGGGVYFGGSVGFGGGFR